MNHINTNVNGTFYFKDPEKKILHRTDGPATEWADGDKRWYFNGKLHREDGPAMEWGRGDKLWYFNGKLHREDGPAIEWEDGDKEWYQNGKLHRIDGPAVECVNGTKIWYVNGRRYEKDHFPDAVAYWLSWKEITQREIQDLIGNHRIVEWL